MKPRVKSRLAWLACFPLPLILMPWLAAASPAQTVLESVEISDLYVFNTDIKTKGAVMLTRDFDNNIVDVTLSSNGLQPDGAYTIWIAVFNNPRFCSDRCGLDDLPGVNPSADPRVKPSVFYGGGFLADAYGSGSAAFKIVPGQTTRELFAGTKNYGLQRLWGTEIHIVLRSHGPALEGSVAQQLSTANGACNPTCGNVFTSFHPPIN